MVIIENDWLKVSINKHGAEVRKVEHKKNGLDYMWTGDEAFWGRVSPILFPIVGRLKDDQYHVDGQTYKMSQHGFLRDVEFELRENSTLQASFTFESAGRYRDVYPYEFRAIIHYTLDKDTLNVNWEIVNLSTEEMYFSIGAHPAFRIPLSDNEKIEDYKIQMTHAENKKVKEYELKNSLIHEKGEEENLSPIAIHSSLFANDALVFSNIDKITMKSDVTGHGVEVLCEKFPFVGIWSKYDDSSIAPFVCIEPWYGIADTQQTNGNFKEKYGINKLKKKEIFQAEYKMKFL